MKNKYLLAMLALALTGCDGLPDAYRGVFMNKSAGIRVTLNSQDADIEFRGKKLVNYSAEEMKFETASSGRAGIFIRKNEGDSMVDVYHIVPNRASKKNEFDFVTVQADLMYTQLDSRKKGQAKEITVVRCKGIISLDWTTKDYELGCPAGAETIVLTRVKESGGSWNPFTMP